MFYVVMDSGMFFLNFKFSSEIYNFIEKVFWKFESYTRYA